VDNVAAGVLREEILRTEYGDLSLAVPVIMEDHWRELAHLLFKGPDFQARDQRPQY
jgi:hypothetical protein